ncbi:MAG: SGNH/GDSL hydrolase family protein [Thermodesulfobacteriota bacterium]
MAVLFCLEMALHFTSYKHLLTRDRHLRYYYQVDPIKGFDIKPNVKAIPLSVDNRIQYCIWSNELGCFDEPYREEKQFILLLGDSFTHSFAPFQDKWGTQIEKLLNYRVLKCGVTGYGTGQELKKAEEIIEKVKNKPQLIIVGYFFNDLSDDIAFPNLTVVDGFLVPSVKYKDPETNKILIEKLTKQYTLWEKVFSGTYPLSLGDMIRYHLDRNLILMNLVNDSFARILPEKISDYTVSNKMLAFEPEDKIWNFWQQHFQNLLAFKKLARADQANLLMVLIPTNLQVYPFLAPHPGIDLERPNRVLAQFFQAQGIDYLDLLPLLRSYADQTPRSGLNPEKDLYWRHNSHWSIRGEHLVGLLVSRYILEHNLLQVPDREAKLRIIEDRLKDFR